MILCHVLTCTISCTSMRQPSQRWCHHQLNDEMQLMCRYQHSLLQLLMG
jgi:hypothetical protein